MDAPYSSGHDTVGEKIILRNYYNGNQWRKVEMARREFVSAIIEIAEEVRSDPCVREAAEEHQLLYGSLQENDLKKIYTI